VGRIGRITFKQVGADSAQDREQSEQNCDRKRPRISSDQAPQPAQYSHVSPERSLKS
jgi:hypothetical protein